MSQVPPFPVNVVFDAWDALSLFAATVFLEAEGEPALGLEAVGWVIRNRMDDRVQTVHQVVLAPYQFSCFNTDARPVAVKRLANAGGSPALEDCWKAAAMALWRIVLDPTHGSTFYLNPTLTRQIRPTHDLPTWYDPKRVKLRVGRHEFLIA